MLGKPNDEIVIAELQPKKVVYNSAIL